MLQAVVPANVLEVTMPLDFFVADDEAVGAHRCDSMLGIQTMPPGYALMLNSDSTHFYWLREDGCCSAIHWDKWKIYLWAKQDFTNQQEISNEHSS